MNNSINRNEKFNRLSTNGVVLTHSSAMTFDDTIISFEYNTGYYNGVFSLTDSKPVVFRNGFQVKFIGNYMDKKVEQ